MNSRLPVIVTRENTAQMICTHRLRQIIATISAAQTLVIVSFFAYGLSSGPTVSSMLYSNTVYRSLLMICVVLQLTLSFVYMCCTKAEVVPESLMVTALVAWIIVNVVYEDSDGNMLTAHAIASGCFITSAGIYLLWIFIETVDEEPTVSGQTCISGCCIATAFITTTATIVCFISHNGNTWMFEHATFALFSATHALLFSIGTQKN